MFQSKNASELNCTSETQPMDQSPGSYAICKGYLKLVDANNVVKVIHEFVMKGIPNKDAMAKLMADSIVDNPSIIHMVKTASNKSSSEQDNGGKHTGRVKSPLKGVNNR